MNEKNVRREKIFRYARLAGEYLQTKSPNTRKELKMIEQELSMNHRQILAEAMDNTDLFHGNVTQPS